MNGVITRGGTWWLNDWSWTRIIAQFNGTCSTGSLTQFLTFSEKSRAARCCPELSCMNWGKEFVFATQTLKLIKKSIDLCPQRTPQCIFTVYVHELQSAEGRNRATLAVHLSLFWLYGTNLIPYWLTARPGGRLYQQFWCPESVSTGSTAYFLLSLIRPVAARERKKWPNQKWCLQMAWFWLAPQ